MRRSVTNNLYVVTNIIYFYNWYLQENIKYHTGAQKTVFVNENCFVKNSRYIQELKKYNNKVIDDQLSIWIKKYGSKIAKGLYFETPVLGMSKLMLTMCIGLPSDINTTKTDYSNNSQWIYYNYDKTSAKYYYFTNNKLITIQN